MLVLPAPDLLTLPREEERVKEAEYLSEVSPRHKPWDQHRSEADDVKEIYAGSRFSRHHRYAVRVEQCSQVLQFARDPPKKSGKQKITLKASCSCRGRHCTACKGRR